MNISANKSIKLLSLLGLISVTAWLIHTTTNKNVVTQKQSYIISSNNFQLLQTELATLNVEPTHQLAIINAVAVTLNDKELAQLQEKIDIKVTQNHKVELSGGKRWGKRKWQPKSEVNDQIDANYLHSYGIYGGGVTIGFLDTGLDQLQGISKDLYGEDKFWGTYDAINNNISNFSNEESGHGTHVASIAGNADYDVYGKVYGVAPNASLVGIKAFDAEGKATYADVIRGIDWALQVKDEINLRVLNMSFSGPARSYYSSPSLVAAYQSIVIVLHTTPRVG